MSTPPAKSLSGQFHESVEHAAEALKAAATNSHELSEEASALLATASTELSKLAESLRGHAVEAAKDAVRFAKHEIEVHPMASLATALAAVAAVIGMIRIVRRNGHNAD